MILYYVAKLIETYNIKFDIAIESDDNEVNQNGISELLTKKYTTFMTCFQGTEAIYLHEH